jgi:hypothetical protein
LDVLAITDHDTSSPEYVVGDKNTPFRLGVGAARRNGMILINSTEITRFRAPDRVGHFNALFLEDVNEVVGKDYFEAIGAAVDQGAFIFLNHPSESWNSHLWKEEFQRLEAADFIHGVEVINGGRYYDNAHIWCNEKGLTVIGTSDLHGPSHYSHGYDPAGHRPMTLIFATEPTREAVREALFAGRTAAYSEHSLYGSPELLGPLFDASLEVLNTEITIRGTGSAFVEVRNDSDVDLILGSSDGQDVAWVAVEGAGNLEATGSVKIPAQRIARITIRNQGGGDMSGRVPVTLRYEVRNFVVGPEQGLQVKVPLTVRVEPEG